jgi:hypothetical protein
MMGMLVAISSSPNYVLIRMHVLQITWPVATTIGVNLFAVFVTLFYNRSVYHTAVLRNVMSCNFIDMSNHSKEITALITTVEGFIF